MICCLITPPNGPDKGQRYRTGVRALRHISGASAAQHAIEIMAWWAARCVKQSKVILNLLSRVPSTENALSRAD